MYIFLIANLILAVSAVAFPGHTQNPARASVCAQVSANCTGKAVLQAATKYCASLLSVPVHTVTITQTQRTVVTSRVEPSCPGSSSFQVGGPFPSAGPSTYPFQYKRALTTAKTTTAAPVPAPVCISKAANAKGPSIACDCLHLPKTITTNVTTTLAASTTTLTGPFALYNTPPAGFAGVGINNFALVRDTGSGKPSFWMAYDYRSIFFMGEDGEIIETGTYEVAYLSNVLQPQKDVPSGSPTGYRAALNIVQPQAAIDPARKLTCQINSLCQMTCTVPLLEGSYGSTRIVGCPTNGTPEDEYQMFMTNSTAVYDPYCSYITWNADKHVH